MKTISAMPLLWGEYTGAFSTQRVRWNFDVIVGAGLNKLPKTVDVFVIWDAVRSLWRHSYDQSHSGTYALFLSMAEQCLSQWEGTLNM